MKEREGRKEVVAVMKKKVEKLCSKVFNKGKATGDIGMVT